MTERVDLEALERRVSVARDCGCAAVVPVADLCSMVAELRETRASAIKILFATGRARANRITGPASTSLATLLEDINAALPAKPDGT